MDNILVIDDDDHVRFAIRLIMEKAGYRVLEASDGANGMKIFMEIPINIVITDIFMPNKDGLELILELKKHNPAVKIIVVTSGAKDFGQMFNAEQMALAFGAAAVINKPIMDQALLKTMEG